MLQIQWTLCGAGGDEMSNFRRTKHIGFRENKYSLSLWKTKSSGDVNCDVDNIAIINMESCVSFSNIPVKYQLTVRLICEILCPFHETNFNFPVNK
jgi:hypothetical protein